MRSGLTQEREMLQNYANAVWRSQLRACGARARLSSSEIRPGSGNYRAIGVLQIVVAPEAR